ncbi:MAG: peptide chain release factor 2 [Eubacteriales bacterium]|nr:peptide chain release factor 2 [Eubacteriales bacterium]MDD3882419.1 peptide chain release factor 2 [Eubacteriales bacterium]MDD4513800.1 peptide chain release factor 2 [Eubacteriales bacterium]
MLEFDAFRNRLTAVEESLKASGDALQIGRMEEQLAELHEEMSQTGFWNDTEHSTKINTKFAHLTDKLKSYKDMLSHRAELEEMLELANEEGGESMTEELRAEIEGLEKEAENLQLETMLRGEYDSLNAILSLHAGAGGTEAQDWTGMLYRMYTRYCERHGFTVKVLEYLDGDEAGVKSVTFEVDGENAYGYLRGEKGVHRLVRISPFDANARRHTSFSSLDVAPLIDEDNSIVIDWEDVRIDTYRSTGAGGQHINKTDSAVRMTHMPSGIVVSCQNERSQVQNKEMCIKMLRSKLLELKVREREEQMAQIKGEMKKIEWGSQIRSYVFQPYTMVKDHRTGFEVGNINDVMDGNLDGFITSYLKML